MSNAYEQPLSDAEKNLLRQLAKDPENNDLRSALKKCIVDKPMMGAPLVDTLGTAFTRLSQKAQHDSEEMQEALSALKALKEMEDGNLYIGEYLDTEDVDGSIMHEVYVQGQGEKVIPLSPEVQKQADNAELPLWRGEKVYLAGDGGTMMIVSRTNVPMQKHGEHGIITAINETHDRVTVNLDGKTYEFSATQKVHDHFVKEQMSSDDLPLPCLCVADRHEVTQILPEPAIKSELNPFLKRNVTLACHAGYTDVKNDFLRAVLARYMAKQENRSYLTAVDLSPSKLLGEAVGIACVGQPGSGKTTLIHAIVNMLDQLSLAQVKEKVEVLKFYVDVHNKDKKLTKAQMLKRFQTLCETFQKNHTVYREHFLLEEPDYNVGTLGAAKTWAREYVEGYNMDPARANRYLKRYLKMQAAGRSEVQLFLIQHEDAFKKYVGEGVGYVGLVFRKARRHNGFVFIWLPEAETIFKARGTGVCSDYNDEIVAKFNEELAGSSSNDNLIAVADSNHPQSMDDALLGHRFVRVNVGRIDPVDLPAIVDIHVKRLDLDESLSNGTPATENARNLICEALLAEEKPICKAVQGTGKSLELYAKDILVPRVIAFITSRAKRYSLSRKGNKKRVTEDDLRRAIREEMRHQASQVKPNNLHLFVDGLDPQDQARVSHVEPLL
jgi:hypothetical protein